MKPILVSLALLGTSVACFTGCQTATTPADHTGRVAVNFQEPEKFTDFKDSFVDTDKGRESLMALLRDFLDREAPPCLPDGQKLTVTFLDIDLAGDFLPMIARGHQDIRVVKQIYPPRIALRYEVTDASGAVVKQGERNLTDLSFMMRVSMSSQGTLHYEFELLRDWLRKDLA